MLEVFLVFQRSLALVDDASAVKGRGVVEVYWSQSEKLAEKASGIFILENPSQAFVSAQLLPVPLRTDNSFYEQPSVGGTFFK